MRMPVTCSSCRLFLGPSLILTLLPRHGQGRPNLEEKSRVLQGISRNGCWTGSMPLLSAGAPGDKWRHTVDGPGNVIHAGVWTGRCLAGVGINA